MKLDPSIFKAYDIRGLYPDQINEGNVATIIKAIYTFFLRDTGKNTLSVVLGRDMRTSSPQLFDMAKKTLVSMGASVIDIGLASTPTFYFAVLKYGYDAGIQISASHNPPQYNGMKFAKRDGNKLIKIGKNTGMDSIKHLAMESDFEGERAGGKVTVKNHVLKEELDFVFDEVKPGKIKKLKVVADPANAMGIPYLEGLFKLLPCTLVKMNFTLDGTFPVHQPDPLEAKNLVDIEKKVKDEKADLGIAPDGDGDRVFFIDENGKVVKASLITSILVEDILKEYPKEKILVDVRYTKNIYNQTKKSRGIALIGKVGHALITEHMIKEDVVFSGESSGHYYYRSTGYAESSLLTILRLINIMSKRNKPLSELVREVETSIESGEFNFMLNESTVAKELMERIASDYSDGKVSWLDGLAVDYPDWRFSIRTSNTEPLMRLNVEGETEDLVNIQLEKLKKKILDSGAKLKH